MAKYHIKKDGTPGVCRAKEGNCPLGGSESHFDSMENAQAEAQSRMEAQFGVVDEPYSKGPIFEGKAGSDYDKKVLSGLNTDGVTVSIGGKPGHASVYKVNHLAGGKKLSFSVHTETTDSVNDYLTGATPEKQFKVNSEKGVEIMSESMLNDRLNSMKDKHRLEQVTHSAVAQYESMNPESKGALELQRRIRENELAGDFVANKNLEAKATSSKSEDRVEAAQGGYAQEDLVHDEDKFVRCAVASNGDPVMLEKLKNDSDPMVRAVVADQGAHLEELSTDSDEMVRGAVARQGYASSTLSKDESAKVRAGVAASGKELDTLINDKDARVRLEVARHLPPGRFGLGLLADDESETIRKYVAENNK